MREFRHDLFKPVSRDQLPEFFSTGPCTHHVLTTIHFFPFSVYGGGGGDLFSCFFRAWMMTVPWKGALMHGNNTAHIFTALIYESVISVVQKKGEKTLSSEII